MLATRYQASSPQQTPILWGCETRQTLSLYPVQCPLSYYREQVENVCTMVINTEKETISYFMQLPFAVIEQQRETLEESTLN